MAPRVTSRRRQPTTRGGPRVTSRAAQPTTGTGRVVRPPRPVNLTPGQTQAAAHFGYRVGTPTPMSGPSAAPPGVPAAPAYSASNLPPDAAYDAQMLLLARQRDQGLANLAGERVRTLGDYGFTEGIGGSLAFDPNNPFSKAALLKKNYDQSRRASAQTTTPVTPAQPWA